MITKNELNEYQKFYNYKNIGQVERSYLQDIILFILSKKISTELIFKGGTSLSKFYGLDRFSEDLDFTATHDINVKDYLIKELSNFGFDAEVTEKNIEGNIKLTFRIKGPLYIGIRESLCKIVLDISKREQLILKPLLKKRVMNISEIPSFDFLIMNPQEMCAEKIRTILIRDKARDIYDLIFLINLGINFDLNLTNKKLAYYNISFKIRDFIKHLNSKKDIWDCELKPLIINYYSFEECKKKILKWTKQ